MGFFDLGLTDLLGIGPKAAGAMASNRSTAAGMDLTAQQQFENEMLQRQLLQDKANHGAATTSMLGGMLANEQPGTRPAGVAASPFASLMAGGAGHDALMKQVQGAQDFTNNGGLKLPAMVDPRQTVKQYEKPSMWEKLFSFL
jgi:hypothetical protein